MTLLYYFWDCKLLEYIHYICSTAFYTTIEVELTYYFGHIQRSTYPSRVGIQDGCLSYLLYYYDVSVFTFRVPYLISNRIVGVLIDDGIRIMDYHRNS